MSEQEIPHLKTPLRTSLRMRWRSAPMMPEWSALRTLGNSRTIQTSYVWIIAVPIAARMIAFEERVTLSLFGAEFPLELGLPFSWKVFYFSALLFAAASLVYSWRCPRMVKEYGNYSQFQAHGKSGRQVTAYLLESVSVIRGDQILVEDYYLRFVYPGSAGLPEPSRLFEYSGTSDIEKAFHPLGVHDLLASADISQVGDAFWWVLATLSRRGPVYRASCTALYAAGFVLMSWVLLQNLLFVFGRI